MGHGGGGVSLAGYREKEEGWAGFERAGEAESRVMASMRARVVVFIISAGILCVCFGANGLVGKGALSEVGLVVGFFNMGLLDSLFNMNLPGSLFVKVFSDVLLLVFSLYIESTSFVWHLGLGGAGF